MKGTTSVGFEFFLDLAHYAGHEADGHPNRSLHGHSYQVTLFFKGDPDPISGYAVDLDAVQACIAGIKADADGRVMNDVPGMGYSMETLARWIADRAAVRLRRPVDSVEIRRPAVGMVCRFQLSGPTPDYEG